MEGFEFSSWNGFSDDLVADKVDNLETRAEYIKLTFDLQF